MNNYLPNDISDYPQFEGKANVHEYQACEDAFAAYLRQSENVMLKGIRRSRLIRKWGSAENLDNSGQSDNSGIPGQGENDKPKPEAPASTDTKNRRQEPKV